jgi:hypothetical protein
VIWQNTKVEEISNIWYMDTVEKLANMALLSCLYVERRKRKSTARVKLQPSPWPWRMAATSSFSPIRPLRQSDLTKPALVSADLLALVTAISLLPPPSKFLTFFIAAVAVHH